MEIITSRNNLPHHPKHFFRIGISFHYSKLTCNVDQSAMYVNFQLFKKKNYIKYFNKYKTFSVLIYSYISTSGIGKTRNCMEIRRPKGGVFSYNFEFSQLPRVPNFHERLYIQYGKKLYFFFYNIAMSKARR
jgi:hypothetical protein